MAAARDRMSFPGALIAPVLVVSMVIAAGALVLAGGQDPAAWNATAQAQMPDGPGKDVMIRTCGICHDPMRAASVRLTVDGWSEVLGDMVRRGAKANDQEQEQILGYLTANFLGEAPKPININTAAQIDFESVLGLLRKEAGAVIAYRTKNGPFKTIPDMKKVPGLDYKKVESQTDRIVCF
jgi:competence protein ComEA